MRFSPGPWQLDSDRWVRLPDGSVTAYVSNRPDGRLIAAAPELLDAVKRMFQGLPSREQREFMADLIRRIEGEP